MITRAHPSLARFKPVYACETGKHKKEKGTRAIRTLVRMTERRPANASGGTRPTGVSFSDATSASDVGGVLQPFRSGPLGNSPAIMEGVLKKRGANLPVMRDRYCVATWEVEPSSRAKFVLLRTYKSQKSYAKSPEKPVSSHALKCFGAWDGKGNFHKYDHAFLMETSESKVFFCTAPTEAEKRKWIDVMKTAAPALNDRSRSNSGSEAEEEGDFEEGENARPQLQRGASSARPSGAKRQSSHGRKGEPSGSSLFEDVDSHDDDDDVGGLFDDDQENGLRSLTDSEQSPDDGLFRSSSGADSVLSGSDRDGASKAEPADWGIYGENFDGPTVSKYDVVDRPVLLLDDELLNQPVDKTPLASDSFLFEDAGPSRFGAVVIKKSERDSDDDLADFVDEGLAARLEREKSEKILKKRVQKLESNRDLYAEMAAARLNSMRKDARHPTKKSPRELSFRPSHVGSVSEYNESEDGYSHMTDAGYDPNSSEAGLFEESEASYPRNGGGEEVSRTRRKSHAAAAEASYRNGGVEEETRARKKPHAVAAVENDEVDDEEEAHYQQQQQEMVDVEAEIDPEVRRENRRKKKREKQQMLEEFQRSGASEIVRPSEDSTLFPAEMYEDLISDKSEREDEAVQPTRRRKSKHKKPSYEETSNETAPTEDLMLFESPDSIVNEAGREDERYEEERRLEKERRREERRARKERQRREEEEAAAAAAAELARQHRDAMREREEEKARKREKKERRERRERAKLEKEKKQRKSKEAELQAEVERLRLAQLQQQAEDEKKEKKKKRKEKYSRPAERIQRKEREAEAHAEAHAAEMSSALVLVETPPIPVTVAPPIAISTPVQSSAPAQDAQQPAPAPPASAPAAVAPAVVIAEPSQPPYSAPTPAPVSSPAAPSPVYQDPALQPVLQPVVQPVFEQQQQQQQQQQQSASTVHAAPQSQPAHPMMPQYIPGYPAPPQSLPMYASSPYGMYQPQYPPQPYYAQQYANMAYGPGVPMQPQYYQPPPVGYMSGAPMMSQQYPAAAYPEMPGSASGAPPRSFGTEEESTAFIGPQLPSSKAQASAPAGHFASIGPPPPPPSPSNAPRSNSPALPDLPDLPDIADF